MENILENKTQDISFKLNGLKINSFSIKNDSDLQVKIKGKNNPLRLNFDIETSISASFENSTILVTNNVEVSGVKNEEEEMHSIASLNCLFEFGIENFDELFVDEDTIEIHFQLATTLYSVCYGTTRGILYSQCQGNVFGDITMPMLNLYNIPRENVKIHRLIKE
jgi:hypothetical protein